MTDISTGNKTLLQKNFPWGITLGLLISVIVLGLLSLNQFYTLRRLEKKVQLTHQQDNILAGHISRFQNNMNVELDQVRNQFSHAALDDDMDLSSIARGICLIQGEYTFTDPATYKPLRHVLSNNDMNRQDASMLPDDATQPATLSIDGKGSPLLIHYTGSGFLVDRQGFILTNYHVVAPWTTGDDYQHVMEAGYEPEQVMLRAFFPGHEEPFDLVIKDVCEENDLAILQCRLNDADIPVLDCRARQDAIKVGQTIYILGYPTGFDLLLARLPESQISRLNPENKMLSYEELAINIAQLGLIQPVATQGICGRFHDDRLIYDAQTTTGGSGAPVLNRKGQVIAVNTALMKGFSGTNFGTPIQFGLHMLLKLKNQP